MGVCVRISHRKRTPRLFPYFICFSYHLIRTQHGITYEWTQPFCNKWVLSLEHGPQSKIKRLIYNWGSKHDIASHHITIAYTIQSVHYMHIMWVERDGVNWNPGGMYCTKCICMRMHMLDGTEVNCNQIIFTQRNIERWGIQIKSFRSHPLCMCEQNIIHTFRPRTNHSS